MEKEAPGKQGNRTSMTYVVRKQSWRIRVKSCLATLKTDGYIWEYLEINRCTWVRCSEVLEEMTLQWQWKELGLLGELAESIIEAGNIQNEPKPFCGVRK